MALTIAATAPRPTSPECTTLLSTTSSALAVPLPPQPSTLILHTRNHQLDHLATRSTQSSSLLSANMSTQPLQSAIVVERVGGPFSFKRIAIPTPTQPHDILIRVRAVALNPVDYKVAKGNKGGEKSGDSFPGDGRIVGYDGAGTVEAVGPAGSAKFSVGDEVWWAGNLLRPGSFQQFQLVDERLVALKPKTLSFEQAASLPLTSITAYEALKERMQVQPGQSILITAGAGGVGSIASQLARHWGLNVIATTSRPETAEWAIAHGAHTTVDHKKGIAKSFEEQQLKPVKYCFNTFSDTLLNDIVPIVEPYGHICGINGDLTTTQVPAIAALFHQVITYHQEFMFGRPVHRRDEYKIGELLTEVAGLVDDGTLVHTMHSQYSWKEVAKAFEYMQSRAVIGKIVMTVDQDDTAANGK